MSKPFDIQKAVEDNKISQNCMMCREKITEEEFTFEDYFTVHRGFTTNAIRGYVCFDCGVKLQDE